MSYCLVTATTQLVLSNFNSNYSRLTVLQEEYYSVAEVSISAKVLLDHYLPDPHSIRVEAEDGILFPHPGLFISHTSVPASSNMMLLPDYSGRGFAVFNYPFNTNVCTAFLDLFKMLFLLESVADNAEFACKHILQIGCSIH